MRTSGSIHEQRLLRNRDGVACKGGKEASLEGKGQFQPCEIGLPVVATPLESKKWCGTYHHIPMRKRVVLTACRTQGPRSHGAQRKLVSGCRPI